MSHDTRYEIILYWSEEDHAFIAEVPELPGCAADGTTYQEALANVQTIMTEWLETAQKLGRPIPQPKAHPAASGGGLLALGATGPSGR
jgi:predicted RNase H-like HicB family nuclease